MILQGRGVRNRLSHFFHFQQHQTSISHRFPHLWGPLWELKSTASWLPHGGHTHRARFFKRKLDFGFILASLGFVLGAKIGSQRELSAREARARFYIYIYSLETWKPRIHTPVTVRARWRIYKSTYPSIYVCIYACTLACMHPCMHLCVYMHIRASMQWLHGSATVPSR